MGKTDQNNGNGMGEFSTATEIFVVLPAGCGVVISHDGEKFRAKCEPTASTEDLKTLLAEVQKCDSRAFIVLRAE